MTVVRQGALALYLDSSCAELLFLYILFRDILPAHGIALAHSVFSLASVG